MGSNVQIYYQALKLKLMVGIIIGSVFAGAGLVFRLFPPKKINKFYGYRTVSSMRNLDTWREGNRFSSVLMLKMGLFMVALGLLLTYSMPATEGVEIAGGLILPIPFSLMLLLKTEQHLRQVFDKNGRRLVHSV